MSCNPTCEATLDGLVHGEMARAGKWMTQAQSINILWAKAVASVVEMIQKRNIFHVFFAFQAILNTSYFWVKNLEKKYSKSEEDTPPPCNWKKIFYIFISCFMPF